jgi:hypothetical protein
MLKTVNVGEAVRHSAKPDWGVGEVVEVTNDKISVRFDHGVVKLSSGIALQHLDAAPLEDIPSARGRPREATSATAARCETCSKALNRSQRSRDGQWKSCPRCSTRDGVHHVYYDYPDGFGETEARASDTDPSGAQSYCTSCRGRGTNAAITRVLCGDPRLGGTP